LIGEPLLDSPEYSQWKEADQKFVNEFWVDVRATQLAEVGTAAAFYDQVNGIPESLP
jgi:hypothetical protein